MFSNRYCPVIVEFSIHKNRLFLWYMVLLTSYNKIDNLSFLSSYFLLIFQKLCMVSFETTESLLNHYLKKKNLYVMIKAEMENRWFEEWFCRYRFISMNLLWEASNSKINCYNSWSYQVKSSADKPSWEIIKIMKINHLVSRKIFLRVKYMTGMGLKSIKKSQNVIMQPVFTINIS